MAATRRLAASGEAGWGRIGCRLGVTVAALGLAAGAWATDNEAVARRVLAMGTWLEVEVTAEDRSTAALASAAAVAAVERAEDRLSTWRTTSDLAALNRQPAGRWMGVTPELAADLAGALECVELTRGAFSPVMGALVEAWGLRAEGREPSIEEVDHAVAGCRPPGLEVEVTRVRRLGEGVRVEEGGFGKGAALRDAADAALAAGAGCVRVDLGGQLMVAGWCAPLEVGVASPVDRDRVVATVRLEGGSVATSGGSERSRSVAGGRLHHVLDPRIGRPVDDWGTVTVLAADPLRADCLATGLLVLGPAGALERVAGLPAVEVVTVRVLANGEIALRATPGLTGRLALYPGTRVEWSEALPSSATGDRDDPRSESSTTQHTAGGTT